MLGKKYEFKPDKDGSGTLHKLFITRKQRLSLLKWVLFGVMLVLLSLVQDVIMCQIRIFGSTTDLVGVSILLICMLLEVDSSAVFAITASTLFFLSGSAPGPYTIVFLTVLGVILNIFRHAFLHKNAITLLLSAAVGMMVYVFLVFILGLFLGHTTLERFGVFCMNGLLSIAVMPILYPIFLSISKIGGSTWKE